MAKSQQEEERLRKERLELLKMKQGIIEESEIIPESSEENAVKYEKPHGFKRITNFFYLNKWILIPAFLAALLIAFLITQTLMREKADLKIIVAITDENSDLLSKADEIEKTIEMYCPDFDGNGKVHVNITTINAALGDKYLQMADVERQKLSREIYNFDNPIAICDKGFISEDIPNFGCMGVFFTDLSDKYPEDLLYFDKGVLCSKLDTEFPQEALICVRALPAGSITPDKKTIEYHEKALIVLQNIIDGNIVNPK